MNRGMPQQQRSGQQGQTELISKFKSVAEVISGQVNYDRLYKLADEIANELNLNSTKIRKFYNFIKRIKILREMSGITGQKVDLKKELNRFIAILMYDSGREENKGHIRDFANGMTKIAAVVKDSQNIEKTYDVFVDFFEALVAFHKYYEVEKKKKRKGGNEG